MTPAPTAQDQALATLIRRQAALSEAALGRALGLARARGLPLGEVLLSRFLAPGRVEALVRRARHVPWTCSACALGVPFQRLAGRADLTCPSCGGRLVPSDGGGGSPAPARAPAGAAVS